MRFFLLLFILISIPVTSANSTTCPLAPRQAYQSINPENNVIYYITDDCTRQVFQNGERFFTYFDSWDDTRTATYEVLHSIPTNYNNLFTPLGPKYRPSYGALVKTPDNPKVYFLLGTEKRWVDNESTFESLGYQWGWIEVVDQRLLEAYADGDVITRFSGIPYYSLVKTADDPRVFRIEPSQHNIQEKVRRHIKNEQVFLDLDYRFDRILEIPKTRESLLLNYEEGNPIEQLADTYTVQIFNALDPFTYTNTDYGFSFDYPNDLRITLRKNTIAQYQTRTNDGSSIISEFYARLNSKVYSSANAEYYIAVSTFIPNPENNLSTIDAFTEVYHTDFPNEDNSVVTQKNTNNGTPYTEYATFNSLANKQIAGRTFVRGNTLYTIGAAYADTYPEETLDMMTNSLVFTDTPDVIIPTVENQITVGPILKDTDRYTSSNLDVSFEYPTVWSIDEISNEEFSEIKFNFSEQYATVDDNKYAMLSVTPQFPTEFKDLPNSTLFVIRDLYGPESRRIELTSSNHIAYVWDVAEAEDTEELYKILVIETASTSYAFGIAHHPSDDKYMKTVFDTVLRTIQITE